ncbi:MAG: hypothetical protein Q9M48_12555 [Rhodobacterales bacterium]|nr:hypothetical protein [Rhodobacterales bacterium]
MNPRHLLRMARWARNPASAKRVRLVFGIVGICVALYAVERFLGWPDFLSREVGTNRWRP